MARFQKPFGSKLANYGTPDEGVALALKRFEELRWLYPNKFPVKKVLLSLRHKYPFLVDNSENGIAGHIPGVEVGLVVRFRAELALLGIHRPLQKGIDWKDVTRKDGCKERAALSVILAGGYEDSDDKGEILIYTGEGGRDVRSKKQVANQKLDGGNEALYNNFIHKKSVRVIRGRSDADSPSKFLYSCDGLYRVDDWEYVKGISDFMVYKFKLVREHNQKPLVWSARLPKPFRGQGAHRDATTLGEVRAERARQRRQDVQGDARAIGEVLAEPAGQRREDVPREEKGKQVVASDIQDEEIIIVSDDDEGIADFNFSVGESEDELMLSKGNEEDDYTVSEGEDDDFMIADGETGRDCIVPAKIDLSEGEDDDFMIADGETGRDCNVPAEIDQSGDQGQVPTMQFGEEETFSEVEKGEIRMDIGELIATVCRDVNESNDGRTREESRDDGGLKQSTDIGKEEQKSISDEGIEVDDPPEQKAPNDLSMREMSPDTQHHETSSADDHNVSRKVGCKSNLDLAHVDDTDLTRKKRGNKVGETGDERDQLDDGVRDVDEGKSASDENEDDNEYEVEKILQKRTSRRGSRRHVEYLIRWKGYREEDNTWERKSNLRHCQELLREFERSQKKVAS